MLLTLALVLPLTFVQNDSLPRSSIDAKEFSKLSDKIVEFFEAEDVDDRMLQLELEEDLLEAYNKAAKRAKSSGDPLSYVGDWDSILEMSKPAERSMKSKIGKGFFTHVYTDNYGTPPVATLLSIPASYAKAKPALIPPAVLVLKPNLGLSGDELEESVTEAANALYGDLLDTHIVLIPLGPSEGEGRRATTVEHEGAWLGPEGVRTIFTGLKVLLFQLRYDRSSLILDGWGEAAPAALTLASLTPTWFAGVVVRGAGELPEDTPITNLGSAGRVLVLNGEESMDLARLQAVEGLDVEVIADAGAWSAPSDEAVARSVEWTRETHRDLAPKSFEFRAAGLEWGGSNWCVIRDLNRRATALPDDKDFPRVMGSIDSSSNTVTLETVNVFDVRLFFSDALLDLDRPVKVIVNGEEKFSGRLERDLQFLLENRYYNNSSDYGVYTTSLVIDGLEANLP